MEHQVLFFDLIPETSNAGFHSTGEPFANRFSFKRRPDFCYTGLLTNWVEK